MNHVTPWARQGFLSAAANWLSDTFKVVALSAAYTQSDSDHFYSALPGGDIIATSGATASPSATNGNAVSNPVVFTSVAGGHTIAGLYLYRDTGVTATSQLLVWWDQDATNFPLAIVTNGGNISLTWPSNVLFLL
jgi:hypothetical protein